MKNLFVKKIFVAAFLLVGLIFPSHLVFASSTCACTTQKGDCLFANLSAGNDTEAGCSAGCLNDIGTSTSSYIDGAAADAKAFQCSSVHANFLASQDAAAKKASAPTTSDQPPLPIISPTFGVPIPNMAKMDSSISSGTLSTNFLAVYINGIYQYLIVISITIAIVMVIIGGFQYVLASGSGNVEKGKTRIKNAIVGVILLLSSYLILRTVNPQLVLLQLVSLQNVAGIPLDTLEFDNGDNTFDDTAPTFLGGSSSKEFDPIFQKYAPCAKINWQYFKGIAVIESQLHPEIMNKHCVSVNSNPVQNCAIGLFQALPYYCTGSLANVRKADMCLKPSLKDPEVNTIYGMLIAKTAMNTIRNNCPNASDATKAFMLYYAHGSGPGALKSALAKYHCNLQEWPPDGTLKTYTNKAGKEVSVKFYNGASRARSEAYANGVKGFGPIDVPSGSCPL